jgi:adenylate cyclase
LQIGINLGDVIIEGDDIYGDGVNIAARLEPLAEPGGICVSSIVNESIGNRIDVRFQDAGDITVKNINRPIRIWKWHPRATPDVTKSKINKPLPKAATASIAVLPFTNMSGDPEQEYFSDGISDDIITDLSPVNASDHPPLAHSDMIHVPLGCRMPNSDDEREDRRSNRAKDRSNCAQDT